MNNPLIAEVREYAKEHYDDGGWDVVVECWSDFDIDRALFMIETVHGKEDYTKPCTSLKEVLAGSLLSNVVSIFADRQADARNSAF